jgi:hypothetical protein
MSKLNQALLDWTPGDIHGLDWLGTKNVDQRLAYSYFEEGYLRKVGPGVFARKNDELDWLGVVRFLQEEMKLQLHISGRTALELHGHGHYVAGGSKKMANLTSYENRSFPSWLSSEENNFEFSFKKSSLLRKEEFLTNYKNNGFEVKISSRELAILEFIDSLDLTSSLETAQNYTESLQTLRPEVMQEVLEKFNSVKAKRVFLFLAEKLSLKFVNNLDLSRISLGTGKRVVVEGGELNKKYQITVDRTYGENPF